MFIFPIRVPLTAPSRQQCDEKRPCSACIRHDVKCSLLDNPPPAILQREQFERQRERSAAASSASPEGSAASVISVDPVRQIVLSRPVPSSPVLSLSTHAMEEEEDDDAHKCCLPLDLIMTCRDGRYQISASRPSRRATAIATRASCHRSTRPSAPIQRGTGHRRQPPPQQAARTRSRTLTNSCYRWEESARPHGSKISN